MKTSLLHTYQTFYIERDYEQLDLFRSLKREFDIQNVIYPGSFVHLSPSMIFSAVTYIDTDAKAKAILSDVEEVETFIRERKEYEEEPQVTFFGLDYRETLPELVGRFDLLISQYAGFISEACKVYLKIGGVLLVNNSHGDAGLAALDNDYDLLATVHRRGGTYRISYAALDGYFLPRGHAAVTRTYLRRLGRGVAYTKTAPLYLFRRTP